MAAGIAGIAQRSGLPSDSIPANGDWGWHGMERHGIPAWPPRLSEEQAVALTHAATDYALAHSIVYRPPTSATQTAASSASSPQPPLDAAIHAPLSLLPTPFPRDLYEQSQALQPLYNDLYARITLNDAFLERVVGGNVVLVDEFQARLWQMYKAVKAEGIVQPLHLGLFRSDYLLHTESDGSMSIKQVELNTISSSFGPLCSRVSQMHRYLAQTTSYYGASSQLILENMPVNESLRTMAAGLAAGHRAYVERSAGTDRGEDGSPPVILFVVQVGERNAFDQRLIEYELAETHGISVRRASMEQLATLAKVEGPQRRLFVTNPASSVQEQVSVVYFRSGYTPADYTTEEAWATRLLLERSLAIKCPTVALQLAGAKKVQQVLSDPGVVEALVQQPARIASGTLAGPQGSEYTWTPSDVVALRASFMPMFGMEEGSQGVEIASDRARAANYVLKPQREGGGNNIYRADIVPELQRLDALDAQHGLQEAVEPTGTATTMATATMTKAAIKRREGYILMRLIEPPRHVGNYLVRFDPSAAGSAQKPAALAPHVISELGAFGAVLFEAEQHSQAMNMVYNHSGGHLLRTKAADSNEGGVAAGFSVIDSPLLV